MMVMSINILSWVPAVRGRAAHAQGGGEPVTSAVRVPAMPQPQLRLPASGVLRPRAGALRVRTCG
jgi:hypothetical protein